jgi:glycosyltransferase involved in cell wall biosynthesis
LLAKLLYKIGLKLVSGIFAQTIHQKEGFKSLTKVKAYHLPSIYSDLPLDDDKDPVKNPFILWVGSNSSRKRPHIFRDIAIQHPHLLFVMIYSQGDGTGGIDEKSGPSNLTYIPSCPRNKIGKYYYKSLFLVSTSMLEGFPNIFLESWYFKRPVLSLDIDPDGIITRHQTGIVVYRLESLHQKVTLLANNEKLRNRLGINGKAYIESNHSPEKVILKFLKILGI